MSILRSFCSKPFQFPVLPALPSILQRWRVRPKGTRGNLGSFPVQQDLQDFVHFSEGYHGLILPLKDRPSFRLFCQFLKVITRQIQPPMAGRATIWFGWVLDVFGCMRRTWVVSTYPPWAITVISLRSSPLWLSQVRCPANSSAVPKPSSLWVMVWFHQPQFLAHLPELSTCLRGRVTNLSSSC
jgi:hypothetical protein